MWNYIMLYSFVREKEKWHESGQKNLHLAINMFQATFSAFYTYWTTLYPSSLLIYFPHFAVE